MNKFPNLPFSKFPNHSYFVIAINTMPCNFAKQPAYLLRSILVSLFVLAMAQFASGQTVPDTTIVNTTITTDSLPVKPKPAVVKVKAPIPVKDSIPVRDSMPAPVQTTISDSVSKKPWFYPGLKMDAVIPLSIQVLFQHPYYGFRSKPVVVYTGIKKFEGKEVIFYALIALLLAFAFLRQAFPKYFSDLFRLLFRTTLKQKQVREQLMQTPLPSLLLNGFFVISAGLYIDILLQHFNLAPVDNFWLLFVYCAAGLSVIYATKFIGLKLSGWIFNMKEGADTYIFIVFIINKVIGVFLLPFLVLLSFMQGGAYSFALMLSWFGIGILIISRFLLTYASVRNQVKFNPFHFFLYLCAFEIAPLLLIYKALLFFFR